MCVEAGGTITGEHGVGLDKRRYMSLVHGPEELDAMRRIKAVFDPLGRMNPRQGPSRCTRSRESRPVNPLAGLFSERLSKAQVVDGFDTEAWAVCGRVPQAVVFPESEEQVAEILSLSSEEGWRCVPGGPRKLAARGAASAGR